MWCVRAFGALDLRLYIQYCGLKDGLGTSTISNNPHLPV